MENTPSNTPRHMKDRAKDVYKDVDTLAEKAGGIKQVEILYLVHDIRKDVYILSEFATRWEDYCRVSGQNPWKYFDGEEEPNQWGN